MKTFWIRTASAVVYALLFIGTLLSGQLLHNPVVGMTIFTAFLLFVAMGCTFEFFRMVRQQGAQPSELLGYLLVSLPLLSIGLLSLMQSNTGFMVALSIIMLFPSIFAICAIVQLWGHSEQPFREAAYTMLPLLYIGLPLTLMSMVLSHNGARVLLMVIGLVWINDSAAYIGGSLFGRHKMWPRHSPGKTWEGTAFGVLVTILVATFVGSWLTPLAWHHCLVIGIICSVIDTLGDLVESMLKRSVGVKDSGNIMPGHGGFLDRFDSLLIIMPFVFAYLVLFTTN
jgi:phosphatidate cytidylyltransferase